MPLYSPKPIVSSATKTLNDMSGMLFEFREEWGDLWSTPETFDAIAFAFTESQEAETEMLKLALGVALTVPNEYQDVRSQVALIGVHLGNSVDAVLRFNPEYTRNNDKTRGLTNELTDVLMMILTALGEDFVFDPIDFLSVSIVSPGSLRNILADVAELYSTASRNRQFPRLFAASICVELLIYLERTFKGYDGTGDLRLRLNRIERKLSGVRV